MTPKRRARSALPRRSATCGTTFGTPRHVPLNLGKLEPGDTPQGKRTKVVPIPVPIPVPATVCLEEQKSRLMQWKRHGLQLLNRYDQYTKTRDMVVRRMLSTAATAYFKRKTHRWIQWANKEHGTMWYQFRKQTYQLLQEPETAVAALRTATVMQASKRLRHTPQKTPAKKLKPVHPQPQDVLRHGADAILHVERPRWVPPTEEDDSGCDYEVMYHDHAMNPPPSVGLAAHDSDYSVKAVFLQKEPPPH